MTTARHRSALVILALTATSCAPEAATIEGDQVEGLYRFFFYFAAVIFVVVAGLIAFNIIRFRERRGDDSLPEQVHTNVALEILWFSVPTVIVIVLFIASFGVLNDVNEEASSAEAPVVVEVEAFQWGWRFTYPGGTQIESLPDAPAEIVLPTRTPIVFELASQDVIHSFYVPRFLIKRDVVPGRANRIDVTIDEAGTYGGKCAEFCGLLHDRMDFSIEAVPLGAFQRWLNEQATEGP